jgi:hypothetical protein
LSVICFTLDSRSAFWEVQVFNVILENVNYILVYTTLSPEADA